METTELFASQYPIQFRLTAGMASFVQKGAAQTRITVRFVQTDIAHACA